MDPKLVDRAKRGDKEAFTTLVLTLGDRLYSVAYRILRDAGRAEDAVQQTFLIAWRELPGLRVVTDHDAGPSTDDAQLSIARSDEIERAFRRLSGEQRALLVMHHYLG